VFRRNYYRKLNTWVNSFQETYETKRIPKIRDGTKHCQDQDQAILPSTLRPQPTAQNLLIAGSHVDFQFSGPAYRLYVCSCVFRKTRSKSAGHE